MLSSGRGIALNIEETLFINIHAPSGTYNKRARSTFYNERIAELPIQNNNSILIGGCFNCLAAAEDQTPVPNICPELQELNRRLKIEDLWRLLHPTHTEFTYHHKNGKSRLDRIYVSRAGTGNIAHAEVYSVIFSDHYSYECSFHLQKGKTVGTGSTWTLNTEHLQDAELRKQIAKSWQECLAQRAHYSSTTE
ncbi:uncharacterized protein LOC124795621 [Schistocerca piceifrons]|uniref:uncharacterized protein LOC124795621 n=1 Tax=Schistocerca piceifrons TaxID=274613 RepID=UPI001F5FF32C|nr:uncharacterized protein LOC124795621 [Schistocerca piceifrons]